MSRPTSAVTTSEVGQVVTLSRQDYDGLMQTLELTRANEKKYRARVDKVRAAINDGHWLGDSWSGYDTVLAILEGTDVQH